MPSIKTPVTVVMPEIKLKIEDLAYMRGLQEQVRCHCSTKVRDKLTFLGLIEEALIIPSDKEVAEFEKKLAIDEARLRTGVKKRDWKVCYDSAWELRNANAPKPEKRFRLTSAGVTFITKGSAKSLTGDKAACL